MQRPILFKVIVEWALMIGENNDDKTKNKGNLLLKNSQKKQKMREEAET